MALIAALFLIVVLAVLGVAAVRIGGSQQQTVNLSLLGDRALAAANSGVQFAALRVIQAGNCTTANANFRLTQGALAGFTVNVTCVPAAGGLNTFDSTAFSGVYGSPDYVWRRVNVTK
jgi:MSHA biogenesis protein MshP